MPARSPRRRFYLWCWVVLILVGCASSGGDIKTPTQPSGDITPLKIAGGMSLAQADADTPQNEEIAAETAEGDAAEPPEDLRSPEEVLATDPFFQGPTPTPEELIRAPLTPTEPGFAEVEWEAADLSALEAQLGDEGLGFGSYKTVGGGIGGGGQGGGRGHGVNGAMRASPAVSPGVGAPAPFDGSFLSDDPSLETWQRAHARPNASRLVVGDDDTLALQQMHASVRVDGFRARVVLELDYLNDRDKALEGTFELRLPNGSSPYFLAFGETLYQTATPGQEGNAPPSAARNATAALALDPADVLASHATLWDTPKVARMIDSASARRAYHDTVRGEVDPALLEWAGAGVFRAHVFPLAPQRSHRVVIGYDVDLLRVGDHHELLLDLPQGAHARTVDLDIAAPDGMVVKLPRGLTAAQADGRLRAHQVDPPDAALKLSVQASRPALLTGQGAAAGPYFATRLTPPLPALSAAQQQRRAVILVDVSLSSNPDQYNIWLALMTALLRNNTDQIDSFAVLFFNVEQFWWRSSFVENTPANVDALTRYARQLALEGATDLGAALQQGAAPSWHVGDDEGLWDVFLLSDGAVTWGEDNDPALHALMRRGQAGALFTYRTGLDGADLDRLDALTQAQGGAIFSAISDAEVEGASRAHRDRPWRLNKVEVSGVEQVLVKGRPRQIFSGQELVLTGRGLPSAQAEATFEVQLIGEAPQRITVPLSEALESPLTERLYGQASLSALERLGAAAAPTATIYARHYRVASRSASLLMLESDEDYDRFKLEETREEDARFISKHTLEKSLRTFEAQATPVDAHPKALFFAHMERIREQDVKLRVPAHINAILRTIPEEKFVIPSRPFKASSQQAEALPKAFRAALASRTLSEASISAEATRRLAALGPEDALKALTSLAEEHPGDTVVAREIAFRAMEWSLPEQAYHLLLQVAQSAPHEPQTYRALADVLARTGHSELAIAYFELGLAGSWEERFGDFLAIHTVDYMRFLRRVALGEQKTSLRDFALRRLRALQQADGSGTADLLISITWNTDDSDIDLHVIDPMGEECSYSNTTTQIGGAITSDVTAGYGPEMYRIRQAVDGTYQIKLNYFSAPNSRTRTRTRAQVLVVKNWGTTAEEITEEVVTVMLETVEEKIDVLSVNIVGRRPNREGEVKEGLAVFDEGAPIQRRYETEVHFQSEEEALTECMLTAMKAHALQSGALTLRVEADAAGAVLEVTSARNDINPEVQACFEQTLLGWTLPEGEGPMTFSKSWTLVARNKK